MKEKNSDLPPQVAVSGEGADTPRPVLPEEDIDCLGTDDIVCAYCGANFGVDSWEFFSRNATDERDIKCDECGNTFTCAPEYTVSYYSCRK